MRCVGTVVVGFSWASSATGSAVECGRESISTGKIRPVRIIERVSTIDLVLAWSDRYDWFAATLEDVCGQQSKSN